MPANGRAPRRSVFVSVLELIRLSRRTLPWRFTDDAVDPKHAQSAIAPALVETPMAKRAAGDDRILGFIRTKQPLDGGRIGRPDDCDGAAVFLLSDAARFVTGQVLAVDGGWCLSEGQVAAGE
ncbi:MAG: SDR family oxidoreductase [Opitutaceae bacterium]|nr:SDR family oxidoreductase [Opitutaceae bacterium]